MPTHPSTPPAVRVVDDLPHPWIDGAVHRGLVIGDDAVALFDEDGQPSPLDIALVGPARVADLRDALLELSQGRAGAGCWQVWRGRGYPSVALVLNVGSDVLCALVDLGSQAHDPGYAASIVSMLRPIVARRSARMILDDDPLDRDSVLIAVNEPGVQSVGEMVACAADAQALLEALEGGRLTFASARDLITGGHADALVGARESSWLDAKGAPYQPGAHGAYELAKDAAAFANADGGLILIPAVTRKDDAGEVIAEIRTLDAAHVDTQAWEDRIAQQVFPLIAGLRVQFVGGDRGQVVVIVPAQPDERKPFLVRGAIQAGRTLAHAVTLPWRDGDRTRFDEIGVLHAALQAQRRAAQVDSDVLERVHLASFPPEFAEVVADARAARLQVDVTPGGFRIHLPHGAPLDVLTRDLHPKIEALALHTVLERLAPFGVPTRRTSRGLLVRG